MSDRQFPIQAASRGPRGPKSIPWDLIAPHEKQALFNHGGQTLQRLAERHSLCACEAVAVLEDRSWRRYEDHADAVKRLEEIVAAGLHDAKEQP